MAKKVKEIVVPLYHAKVILSFDVDHLSDHLYKKYSIDHSIAPAFAGQAAVFEYAGTGVQVHSLYVSKDDYSLGYVTHECIHCAWHVLNEAGVEVTAGNHEALAYLAGWLADEVNKFYTTGK